MITYLAIVCSALKNVQDPWIHILNKINEIILDVKCVWDIFLQIVWKLMYTYIICYRSTDDINNYRPISILPVSKILKKHVSSTFYNTFYNNIKTDVYMMMLDASNTTE